MASFADSNLWFSSHCQQLDHCCRSTIYTLFSTSRNDAFHQHMCWLDHTQLFTFSAEYFSHDMDVHWALFVHLSWTIHFTTYHSASLCTNYGSLAVLFGTVCWHRSAVHMSTSLWCALLSLWWSMLLSRNISRNIRLDWKWHINGTWHSVHQYDTHCTSFDPTLSNETIDSHRSWSTTVGKHAVRVIGLKHFLFCIL